MTGVENLRTGGSKTLALKEALYIKKLILWLVVVTAIFALHDNPPRHIQAETRSETVAVQAETPKEQPQATLTTQPKVEEKAPAPVPQPKPQPVQGVTNCGDNVYKQYIYQKESGCRTNAINPNGGACGIGQALPCSKLPCTLSDFACQDAWFSNYAITRYGSWEAAYNFWLSHRWW
jgi:hypothetical protein